MYYTHLLSFTSTRAQTLLIILNNVVSLTEIENCRLMRSAGLPPASKAMLNSFFSSLSVVLL